MSPYRDRLTLRREQFPWRKRIKDWWHWLWCHRFRLWNTAGEVETWFEGYGEDRALLVGFRCGYCYQLHQVHKSESSSHGPTDARYKQSEEWRQEMHEEWVTHVGSKIKRVSGVSMAKFVEVMAQANAPALTDAKLAEMGLEVKQVRKTMKKIGYVCDERARQFVKFPTMPSLPPLPSNLFPDFPKKKDDE